MTRRGRAYFLAGLVLLAAGPGAAQQVQGEQSPASLGFRQYYKCPSDLDVDRLGDTGTAKACLAACMSRGRAAGCWWLDGSGYFPRECRVCRTLAPTEMMWPNDWALPLTTVVSSATARTTPKS